MHARTNARTRPYRAVGALESDESLAKGLARVLENTLRQRFPGFCPQSWSKLLDKGVLFSVFEEGAQPDREASHLLVFVSSPQSGRLLVGQNDNDMVSCANTDDGELYLAVVAEAGRLVSGRLFEMIRHMRCSEQCSNTVGCRKLWWTVGPRRRCAHRRWKTPMHTPEANTVRYNACRCLTMRVPHKNAPNFPNTR